MTTVPRLKPPAVVPEKVCGNRQSSSALRGAASGNKPASRTGQGPFGIATLLVAHMKRDPGLEPESQSEDYVFCSRVRS